MTASGRRSPLRLAALAAAAAAAALIPWPPEFIEQWFARGWYPRLQPVLTTASNTLPVAWLDLLALGAIVAAVVRVRRVRRTAARRRVAVAWLAGDAVALVSLVYLLFLVTWGFNYRRVGADELFAVDRTRVTPERVMAAALAAASAANASYGAGGSQLPDRELVAALAPALARAQRDVAAAWTATAGRPKHSLLAFTFPVAGVDGMVNPLALEVILNPDVLPVERPFVLAHEWGHLAGFADEREASFMGWLICMHGPPAARYSGWLAAVGDLARAVPAPHRARVLDSLGSGPRADLRAIARRVARANPAVASVSWHVYDRYLRANQVPGGIASYDDVVRLLTAAPAARPFLP